MEPRMTQVKGDVQADLEGSLGTEWRVEGPGSVNAQGWGGAGTIRFPSCPCPLAGGSSRSRTSRLVRACCARGSTCADSRARSYATTNCCWAITACTCAGPWSDGACSKLWGRSRPKIDVRGRGLRTARRARAAYPRQGGEGASPSPGRRRDRLKGVDTVSLIIKNDLVQKPFLSAKSRRGVRGGDGR